MREVAALRARLRTLGDLPRPEAGETWQQVFADDALVRLCHPFETMTVPEAWERALEALYRAAPDLERRVTIDICDRDHDGALWLGQGGYYTGVWRAPFEGIPATGHVFHLRFHEFFRLDGGAVMEMQGLWDLPELMMQAGVWPMVPSLGREWHVPQPSDGLGPHDPEAGAAAKALIVDMLAAMKRHPAEGGPELMDMARFWHPRCMWYGPCGIGTGRGIDGFRRHHQVPFLRGMPDRGAFVDEITYHFLGAGNYVGVTGWPDMKQTISHGGWLGIPPVDKVVTMRSLDFWRLEGGLIRENWVMVDLLDMYHQIGVDVLARMRELADPLRPV